MMIPTYVFPLSCTIHGSKRVIGSTEALDLTELPKRAAVIGAGPLGAEFACIWNNFGVEVQNETIETIQSAEDDVQSNFDLFSSYFTARGDLLVDRSTDVPALARDSFVRV